jgi:hypothetical protein
MGKAVLAGDTAINPYLKESGEKACNILQFFASLPL